MAARDHVIRAGVLAEIADERRRQIEVEGWTPEHDDEHANGQMADAAACYACPPLLGFIWPWEIGWWKPTSGRRNLIKAAALIVAEIERLDRASDGAPLTRQDGIVQQPWEDQ